MLRIVLVRNNGDKKTIKYQKNMSKIKDKMAKK